MEESQEGTVDYMGEIFNEIQDRISNGTKLKNMCICYSLPFIVNEGEMLYCDLNSLSSLNQVYKDWQKE